MTRKKRIRIVLGLMTLLIVVDHVTKWVAIHYLKDSGNIHIFLGDLFRLQSAENTGAFLRLGATLPGRARAFVMIGMNTVILAGVMVYLFAAKHITWMPMLALVCIAGGGVGNLIDRVLRDGRVVDFMNMGINLGGFSLRTGIFNVADVAIMAGLFLIVFNELTGLRGGQNTDNKAQKG